MSKLALLGGAPVRTAPFPAWPVFDETEERALLDVLHGGRWWRYTMGEAIEPDSAGATDSAVATFQRDFAQAQGSRFGIACSTGTAALEVGLKALGVRPGDDVVVPPYTFIASPACPIWLASRPWYISA